METVVFFLVLSTLPQLAEPLVSSVAPYRAVAEIVSGDSRIFSGEGVQFRCSVPDGEKSTWRYRWFKGSEELHERGQILVLWAARIDDTGKFYCQGVRDTLVGDIHTLQSLPVEIFVDGGWALTHVTPQPGLVGRSLEVTCLVRGKRPLSEVIFYRDGVEVMRNQGNNPKFFLSNLTIGDQGMYSCRASWDVKGQTHSVISTATPGRVREVLSMPVLEINVNTDHFPGRMKLICHHEYNLPAPAPPLHFYFYKNNNRLGTATSENQMSVRRTPGEYSCKVRVPVLNLVRNSEPKGFGQMAGPRALKPSVVPPRPRTSGPIGLIPTTQARLSPQKSAVNPLLVSPQDVATQWSVEPAEASTLPSTTLPSTTLPSTTLPSTTLPSTTLPSTTLPSTTLPSTTLPSTTLPSTVQSLNQTAAPRLDNSSEASGEMSGESGDFLDDDTP